MKNASVPSSEAAEGEAAESSKRRRTTSFNGSKAKKARHAAEQDGEASSSYHSVFRAIPPAMQIPQSHLPEVNEHNERYYEFQWRILNLCSEFYAAADEILVGTGLPCATMGPHTLDFQNNTSPLALAQSYAMGPDTPIDPITLVKEAKRVCDHLVSAYHNFVAYA
jgi:hypothetical protein